MDRNVRASDADRDRVADALRRHFAEGRLTPEEFDERLGVALQARTMGDLADLVADLPQDPDGYALPVPVSGTGSSRISRRPPSGPASTARRAQFASYITASLISIIVWFASGSGSFWPIWVIGPWGIVLLGQAIRGPGPGGPLDGRDRSRRRSR